MGELYFHCILTSLKETSVIYCIFDSPCSKHLNGNRDKVIIKMSRVTEKLEESLKKTSQQMPLESCVLYHKVIKQALELYKSRDIISEEDAQEAIKR